MTAEILERVGLFLARDCLDRQTCEAVIEQLRVAELNEGRVARSSDEIAVDRAEKGVVDKTIRSASSAKLDKRLCELIEKRILNHISDVGTHYGLNLNEFEGPEFLVYGEGDFFEPHCDNDHSFTKRAITAVIELNARDDSAHPYEGGTLVVYAKTDTDQQIVPLPVIVDPGALVTFRAETVHSVARVTQGVRYAVIGWYCY